MKKQVGTLNYGFEAFKMGLDMLRACGREYFFFEVRTLKSLDITDAILG